MISKGLAVFFRNKKDSSWVEYKFQPEDEVKQQSINLIWLVYLEELEKSFGEFIHGKGNETIDEYLTRESLPFTKAQKGIRKPKDVSICYDPVNDKIFFRFYHKDLPKKKHDLEIVRNSHEDRRFRHILLAAGLISESQSKAIYTRKILPRYLSTADMPVSIFADDYLLGRGENDKEITWDSSIKNHLLVHGWGKTGKTNLTRNILASVFHHTDGRIYEIDLSIKDPKPKTKYRHVSRGCATTIDAALERLEDAYSIARSQGGDPRDQNMLVIDNVDLLLPHWVFSENEMADPDFNKKQEALALIKKILLCKGNEQLHLVLTFSKAEIVLNQLKDVIEENGSVASISLGRVGHETSRQLFNNVDGYHVSPYIKGRGYAKLGNDPGEEFQSYFIEEDYIDYLTYSYMLQR